MNTTEKLKAIRAKCVKRIEFYGNGKRFPGIPDCLLESAEAGWRATIAAIDACITDDPTFQELYIIANESMISQIITAWEGQI